jgi:multidrug transporter EmrE-like cation transporter
MDVQTYLLLLIAIVFAVMTQLLLKQGMLRRPSFRLKDLMSLTGNFPVLGGFICLGVSILLYLQALSNLNLSVAYPTLSLGYVLVIIMSKVCFKEPITRFRWIAVLIICAGVSLVGLG